MEFLVSCSISAFVGWCCFHGLLFQVWVGIVCNIVILEVGLGVICGHVLAELRGAFHGLVESRDEFVAVKIGQDLLLGWFEFGGIFQITVGGAKFDHTVETCLTI